MPAKIKPSSKQYIKDERGRMTNKFKLMHYTPSNMKTEELKKLYKSDSYKRKKSLIKKELIKRGKWEN